MYYLYYILFPNEKFYIGITNNYHTRMSQHKRTSNKQPRLQRAIKKYGWDNCTHGILEIAYTIEEIKILEKTFIERFDSTNVNYGYNDQSGGDYFTCSESTKQKHRDYNKNPEVKERKSKELKIRMSDPIFKEVVVNATKINNELRKEQITEQMRLQHKNPEYHTKVMKAIRSNEPKRFASLRTPEYRNLVSIRNIKLIEEGKSKLPINRKPIICNETKQEFKSITDAAKFYSGKREHLRDHLKGNKARPRFKGLTFTYSENKNEKV